MAEGRNARESGWLAAPRREPANERGGDATGRHAEPFGGEIDEVLDELLQIVEPRTQRGQMDGKHRESEVEILAEQVCRDQLL